MAELTDNGYAGITFEGVAAAADTSKPVLYRRWSTKAEMVSAALSSTIALVEVPTPDTGSLAEDIRAILDWLRHQLKQVDRRTILGLLADVDGPVGERFRDLLLTRGSDIFEPVTRSARRRGELGDRELPQWLLALPLELVRHDILLSGDLPENRLTAIVDDITIPAWSAYSRR